MEPFEDLLLSQALLPPLYLIECQETAVLSCGYFSAKPFNYQFCVAYTTFSVKTYLNAESGASLTVSVFGSSQ